MQKLKGKAALVTGSARGTGAVIARLLVEEGAQVLLTDVLEEPGEALAAELGPSASFQRLDVSLEDDWRRGVDRCVALYGGVDILVNNAAVLHIGALEETSPETMERLFRVNQLGPFLGIRAVIDPMRKRGGGSIVNVASSDGVKGMNGVVAYASTKWGLRGATKSAAMELARDRIRVNAVCPEAGNSEMTAPFLPPGVDAEWASQHNLGQILPAPEGYRIRDHLADIARMVLFLASDDCPTATGADWVIDGGLTAGYVQRGLPGS